MNKTMFEERHGKLPSNVVYLDLDDPRNQVPPEVVTAGWTDTQIRSKHLVEINQMIASNEKALESLRETIKGEQKRVDGLQLIRQRKLLLGD